MPRSILIVDANPGLGGMLQQAFTSAGFSCTPALTAEEAVRFASSTAFDLAIIDFHIPDCRPEDLIRALRALQPAIILLGIPPDNNPENPILDELGMQGGLYKPFYLPKLVRYVSEILGNPLPQAPEIPEEEPARALPTAADRPLTQKSFQGMPWMEDVEQLSEFLKRVTADNPVVACMVTRGQELRGWTGELSREQLSLVARKVAETWANVQGGTLARYVRLPRTNKECFLFSSSLTVDLDLTLLFDVKTPVAETRKRAQAFMDAFGKSSPGTGKPESVPVRPLGATSIPSLRPSSAQRMQEISTLFAMKQSASDEFPPSRRLAPGERPGATPLPLAEKLEGMTGAERMSFPQAEEESGEEPALTPEREAAMERRLRKNVFQIENPPSPDPVFPAESMGERLGKAPDAGRVFPQTDTKAPAVDTRKTIPAGSEARVARFEELPVDSGLRVRTPAPAGFESPTPALVKLAYTIVLMPTFPGSRLTPEMAADLGAYIRNLTIAFGWKALNAVIEPGHIAVSVSAPPHVAPSFIIRVLRRNSSQRLFARFPALADNNPAPDFWAPGYLLIGSEEAPTPQQLGDYLTYTRRAQGLKAEPEFDDF